jgi:glycosyltransferase involved in cell wall biosynthesis
VLQVLAPGPAGGLESVVSLLAPGLVQAGVRVTVALVLGRADPPHALEVDLPLQGVAVRALRLPARAYLQEYRELAALAGHEGIQLVHSHGYRSDLIATRAARARGLPTVSTVHGFTGGDWKNRLYERLQRAALKRIDRVVAVSRTLADELTRRGVPRERIVILPNAWAPARPALPREEARAVLGLDPAATVIGWVGRLQREKGPDVMLEALAGLAGDEISLSMLGVGRERARLERAAAERGLAVRFHGLVPDAGRLMRAFDCYVLSSRTEGTPIALFEAMGAGTPVVTTAVGGVPDVVGEAEALLVPPDAPEVLARVIRQVLREPAAAAQRAAQARVRLLERYAPGPWIERHIQLYQLLLRGNRRGALAS